MNAHDAWLQQPYMVQDQFDADYTNDIEDRVNDLTVDLMNGNVGDTHWLFEDAQEIMIAVAAMVLKPGTDAEKVAAMRGIVEKEIQQVAKWLVDHRK